jgi:predicted 3-demethylubiquinone-9 3-methyltransferase (glyoxalase superfamily)
MSKPKILTSFWYAKDAVKAAKFYASLFPKSRVDSVWTLNAESPSGPAGTVEVVEFTLFGQPYQAMSAGKHDDFNDAISMVVRCKDQKELDKYWKALLRNGGREQACGWLTDRYGVRWQLVPEPMGKWIAGKDKARSRRVANAMLQMVKLDFAKLEKAYKG